MHNDWEEVEHFKKTWEFLPNDTSKINELSSDDKTSIILLLLDYAWRPDQELQSFLINTIKNNYFTP